MTARRLAGTGARRWLLVSALLLLAALLRESVRFYDEIAGDDATVALVARHFLTGEASELVVPPTAARHIMVDLTRPDGAPPTVSRLCVRTEPLAG